MQFITKTQCFRGSWRDTAQALYKLPLTFCVTFMLLLIVSYTVDRSPMASFSRKIAYHGFLCLTTLLTLVVSANLAIRVSRYTLLGETRGTAKGSLQRYLLLPLITCCGVGILVPFALFLGFMLIYLLHSFGIANDASTALFVGGASIAFFFGGVGYVWVRLSLLYPHIAAGGKLDWRDAWYDSQDHFWEMLAMFICTTLPITIVSTVLEIYLPHVFAKLGSAGLLHDIWMFFAIVLHLVNLALCAACSTWIYRRFAKELQLPGSRPKSPRLRGPANLHERVKQAAS